MSEIIVAPATAPRHGRRAVVRLSGEGSHALVRRLARLTGEGRVKGASFLAPLEGLEGWAYLFRKGASYTTEEMAELHIPGNPLLVTRLLRRSVALGAREAARGEFTLRAVRGGRLSLQQALAVMHLTEARTDEERREALGTLTGAGQDTLAGLRERVMSALVQLENELDFDDLDEGLLPPGFASDLLGDLQRRWGQLHRAQAQRGLPRVVLKGPCNAGKSTLFNALGGQALVSTTAGTTRDCLEMEVTWGGQRFILVDTPGTTAPDTLVDAASVKLAADQWDTADLVVHLSRADEAPEARSGGVDWLTCADLAPGLLGRRLSALSGEGVDALRDWIVARLMARRVPTFMAGGHPERIETILRRMEVERQEPAALAASLRELAQELNPAGQAVHPDEILHRLFSSFCVGK